MADFNYTIVKSLGDIGHINNIDEIFADIETENFYGNTRLIQVYQPSTNAECVYIIDTDIVELSLAKEWLLDKWLIFHRGSYDLGTLNIVPARLDDTLYLARTAYPEWSTQLSPHKGSRPYSLDTVVSRLGFDHLYANIDKKSMQKGGFIKGAYLSNKQLMYSATDVYALAQIWKNARIQATREVLAYKVDILNLRYCVQYQQNNLIVNQVKVRQELDSVADIIEANNKALNGLNPNSPKQVKEFLGTASSDKETLIRLITDNSAKSHIAKLVYDQRRLLKRKTFLTSYNFPYVTTKFDPAGAATGRFTSTGGDLARGINAQQITRSLQYLFNTDTEDTVVIHADYSTAELRAGCSIMKDTQMYEELKAGKDLHKIAATLALGGNPEDITKEQRQKGKAISFGFIFGMSAPSFVEYAFINYGVVFTQDEAKAIKSSYQKRYPMIAKYAKDRWNDYKTTPVQTPLGRRNKAKLGTDAINYATQGGIAETTKLAIHYLVREYPETLEYIYNVVHDAIYLRVPKGAESLWADRLANAMKTGWVEMCKRPMLYFKDIPMPVEVEFNNYSSGEAKYIVKEY